MVYKYFDKKSSGSCIKNENMSDEKLAEELRKSIIRKFNRRKVNYTNQLLENLISEKYTHLYRQYSRRRSRRCAINK